MWKVPATPESSVKWGLVYNGMALMYSSAVGGIGLEFIAAFLLFLLTVSIFVLSLRTVHALVTGRILTA